MGCLVSLVVLVPLFLVLENLPFVVARSPTIEEVETSFGPPYPAAFSPYLTFTLPSNTNIRGFGGVSTNSLGYRGRYPEQTQKPEGRRRLLFLGDSFTLGWGLAEADSLPARLQKWLDVETPGWEVINAAYHAGCSPDAYYAYLKREGLALAPDLILVLLYTGNDVEDLRDNVWTSVDELGGPVSLYSIRSYADYQGRMLNPRLLPWYYDIPILNRSRVFLTVAGGVTRAATGEGIPRSGRVGKQLSPEEAWQRFVVVSRATVQLARNERVPIAYAALALPGTPSARDQTLARLRPLLEWDLRVPFLALHDVLRREHQLPGDAHLNAEGARVATEMLRDFVGQHAGRIP